MGWDATFSPEHAETPEYASARTLGLRDFADWMPPTLVMELRRGLRSRVFSGVFLFAALACPLWLIGVALYRAGIPMPIDDASIWQGMFWGTLGVLLVVLLPMSMFSALESEYVGGGLELISLSGMTSGAVVFGKWMTVFVQAMLVGAVVLPALGMTYFLGEAELVRQFDLLCGLIALSGVAAAVVLFNSRFVMWVRLMIYGVLLFFGLLVVILVAAGLYYFPWLIPFLSPVCLIVTWFFTRELVAHPAEPIGRGRLPAVLFALVTALLPLAPVLRSGLFGMVALIVFCWLWMRAERML